MFFWEIFILEFSSVDRFTSSSITASKITSLGHKFWDNSMEFASFEMKWLTTLSNSLFSCTERSEIFTSVWYNVSVKLENNSLGCFSSNWNIKEYLSCISCWHCLRDSLNSCCWNYTWINNKSFLFCISALRSNFF